MTKIFSLAGLCVFFFSCSFSKTSKDEYEAESLSGMKAYQQAGGRIKVTDGVGGGSVNGGSKADSSLGAALPNEEDIVWAPEDDNVPMPDGLEEVWKAPENKSWHVSYKEALRLSRKSGKPLMIWFTDSAHGMLCKKLSDELFSNSGFDNWASEEIVRLRIDNTIPHNEKYEDIGVRKKDYVEKLKKRYKVMGFPTVLILSPRGAVVARYRGYKKGRSDMYWARMKHDIVKAADDYGVWREKMERRGYRVWTSRSGRKTFAKLYRYASGKVILINPDGDRGTTSFRNLSDEDQAWLMLKKKQYEAKKRSKKKR